MRPSTATLGLNKKSMVAVSSVTPSFYLKSPADDTISVYDFMSCATDRLEILCKISASGGNEKGNAWVKNRDVLRDEIHQRWINTIRNTKTDQASHYTLRLAFRQDPDKQRWFVQQECRLMAVKLHYVGTGISGKTSEEIYNILESEGLTKDWTVMHKFDAENEEDLWRKIGIVSAYQTSIPSHCHMVEKIIRMPFSPNALSLLFHRCCVIHGGFAYVEEEQLKEVALCLFEQHLNASFVQLRQRRTQVEKFLDDSKTGEFCDQLSRVSLADESHVDNEMLADKDKITLYNISSLESSFPPCMRRLMQELRKSKHLKHMARLQLWRFLKGGGMTVDHQIDLWKGLWHSSEKFDKEMAYNIRYIYGMEGKREPVRPYSCATLWGSTFTTRAANEFHGCPFRNLDDKALAAMFRNHGISDDDAQTIKSHRNVPPEHGLACQEYFRAIHPGSEADGVGNLPNAYYRESRKRVTGQRLKLESNK